MLRHTKTMTNGLGVTGFCAVALAATACAGGSGGSAVSLTTPSVAAVSTSRMSATAAVDGPLIALKRAVANCGEQGNVFDVLQAVFGGVGHSPAIVFISDNGSTFTFSLGSTIFTITYIDNTSIGNGVGQLSCGDTVTGATP